MLCGNVGSDVIDGDDGNDEMGGGEDQDTVRGNPGSDESQGWLALVTTSSVEMGMTSCL